MPARTTDNFLASERGKSYSLPRSVVYLPRSDFLAAYQLQVSNPPPKPKSWLKLKLSQRKLEYVLATAILTLGIGAGLISLDFNHRQPEQVQAFQPVLAKIKSPPKPQQPIYGLPSRLKIPAINVDAALDYVALTPQGALGVPTGPNNAAWYDQGPRPGEKGNSIIDGHFGYKDNIPAVFDNLHKLQAGNNLFVEDQRGATTAFVVREVRTYGQNENDSSIFNASDSKAHLNLITCEGVWNKTQASYSNRLVVFADKET